MTQPPLTAFVLGGGGVLGSTQVGMARALAERGVRPDLVLGTSIGAVNGCFVAADPTVAGAERLAEVWEAVAGEGLIEERGAVIRLTPRGVRHSDVVGQLFFSERVNRLIEAYEYDT